MPTKRLANLPGTTDRRIDALLTLLAENSTIVISGAKIAKEIGVTRQQVWRWIEKLRALGVTTAKRTPALPELAPIAESGVPGFDVSSWYALFAPARTPPEVIRKASADTRAALADLRIVAAPAFVILQIEDELVRMGELGGFYDLGVARGRPAITDVVAD